MWEVPILISLNYDKDVIIFPFTYEHAITIDLLQNNKDGFEKTISFFKKYIRDAHINYKIMENKAYALVKSLKSFREYVLQAQLLALFIAPQLTICFVSQKKMVSGTSGSWVYKNLIWW